MEFTEDEKMKDAALRRFMYQVDMNTRMREAVEKGTAEGLSKGLAEGLSKGMARGMVKGILETRKADIVRIIEKKWVLLPEDLKRIENLKSRAKLEKLFDTALEAESREIFFQSF